MSAITEEIRSRLLSLREDKYASFSASLIPNIPSSTVIGVRAPILRKYAGDLSKRNDIGDFLCELPHKYHEENCLHAYILGSCTDIDEVLCRIDDFLPYITNWAICDCLRARVLSKHKDRLLGRIFSYLGSEHPYTVRFAVEMLMLHFLRADFDESYPMLVAQLTSDEYYVNMMRAWYFAEALAWQYDKVLPYFTNRRLDAGTHKAAVRKAIESFKISDERKAFLKTLR